MLKALFFRLGNQPCGYILYSWHGKISDSTDDYALLACTDFDLIFSIKPFLEQHSDPTWLKRAIFVRPDSLV